MAGETKDVKSETKSLGLDKKDDGKDMKIDEKSRNDRGEKRPFRGRNRGGFHNDRRGGGHGGGRDNFQQRNRSFDYQRKFDSSMQSEEAEDNTPQSEKKFTGRSRLFVGNLTDITEEEFRDLFKGYGELSEIFINPQRGFGFVRLVGIQDQNSVVC